MTPGRAGRAGPPGPPGPAAAPDLLGPAGPVAALVLAAGASSRMRGRDKLVEQVRGRPLLADRVAMVLAVGGLAPVLVALPPEGAAPDRWAALDGLPVVRLPVAEPARGLSESLRTGIAALPAGTAGLLVLPGDMPDLTAEDLRRVLSAFDATAILRGASATGQPGHPVLFPASHLPALARLRGDRGGRDLLAEARAVTLPGAHALTDLDTPEDWAAWRARS